jgi:hypothetical protein
MEDPTLLSLATAHLGSIIVLSPILVEVNQLHDAKVERLGLAVVEPEIDLIIEASARRGGLSYRDRICLLRVTNVGFVSRFLAENDENAGDLACPAFSLERLFVSANWRRGCSLRKK